MGNPDGSAPIREADGEVVEKGIKLQDVAKVMKQAKTKRGRRILAAREPQIHEPTKNALIIKGHRVSGELMELLREFSSIRKPNVVLLSGKSHPSLITPFEKFEPIEFLAKKNQAPVFCVGSSNKKHPARLFMGRTFDHSLLDMYEFDIANISFTNNKCFKEQPYVLGSKPLCIFQGGGWESTDLMREIQNVFLDFFGGFKAESVRFEGIDRTLVFTTVEDNSDDSSECPWIFRVIQYSISMERSGTKLPLCKLHDIGPNWDMKLLRHKSPSFDAWKASTRIPKEDIPNKVKNVSTNTLGATIGRVHLSVEQFSKLHTPHGH